MRRIFADVQGSISAYSAILAVLGIGGAALAVDFGRAAVLRTQMQDRADAGAMAAAGLQGPTRSEPHRSPT